MKAETWNRTDQIFKRRSGGITKTFIDPGGAHAVPCPHRPDDRRGVAAQGANDSSHFLRGLVDKSRIGEIIRAIIGIQGAFDPCQQSEFITDFKPEFRRRLMGKADHAHTGLPERLKLCACDSLGWVFIMWR